MLDRIVIVPRWGGTADRDWYPALTAQHAAGRPVVVTPLLPEPGAPEIEPTVDALQGTLDAGDPARTLVVGHSVGCQAVLRAAAQRNGERRLGAILLVAAWWTVDEPWDTLRPWIDTPVDTAAARRTCERWQVLLSDNDPFTSDHAANRAAWVERLGATVEVIPGREHFNEPDEPVVFRALGELLGA